MESIRRALALAGGWLMVLPRLGIDDRFLTGKNTPCPMCGGRDRFQFTIKGHGAEWGRWHCRHCGGGDGFRLAMLFLQESFPAVLQRIAVILQIPAESTSHQRPKVSYRLLASAQQTLLMLTIEASRACSGFPEEQDSIACAYQKLMALLHGQQLSRAAVVAAHARIVAYAVATDNAEDQRTLLLNGNALLTILMTKVREVAHVAA